MAKTLQKKIKFSKGQVSPELLERTDLTFYDSSAQEMKNVVSTIYGGVRTRRGTKYVDGLTYIDERAPSSITSDVFGDTTHFTDLTTVTSNTLSANKLFALLDYGSGIVGTCKIEIKNIKVLPYSVEYKTAGTSTVTLESGKYNFIGVGGGGGGRSMKHKPFGDNYYYMLSGGGSGAYINGTRDISAGTYSIVVGGGGSKYTSEYNSQTNAGSGGSTTLFGCTAGGGIGGKTGSAGGGGTYSGSDIVGSNGNAGVYSHTPHAGTANGGASKYGGYGAGGYGNTNVYATNGGTGYAKISLVEPSYHLIFSVSDDGVTWEEVATRSLSTTETDISVNLDYCYQYVKIEISGDEDLSTKISFQYLRNDASTVASNSIPMKMHEFIYNNEDRYLLVFLKETIQVFKDDVLVQIVNASGLLEDYVKTAKVAYKDDTIIITHPLMQPKQLQRQSDGTWAWSNFTLKNIPYYLFGTETSTTKTTSITPSGVEGSIKITAASSIFDSTWVGQFIDGNGGRVRITEYTSGTVVKGVTIIPFYTTDAITSWTYISGYEAVWSATRGYPSTCLFAQQRLWFGGSYSLPSHIWASRLDDYNNFKNAGNYDNDAIDVTMLTNNRIMNLVEQRGIHVFTSGDEWTIKEGTYTPNMIAITKNTENGSYDIRPEVIGGSVCFIEKNGKSLLSYAYDYDQASFMTENISLFSSLIDKPVAFDVEVNSAKDKADFIYIVLEDGTMLSGCVLLDQKIISLSKFITDGAIKDICCVLEDVYLLVDRNGNMCLEKITNERTDCVKKENIISNTIEGLYRYNDKYVYVYSDSKLYGKYFVQDSAVELETVPNETCNIGIAYDFYLESNPIAINGKTTNIKKRISTATITCKNTERLEFNGQKKQTTDDIFDFYSCTKYGNDVRFNIKGEFYPVDILSVLLNINYEG